VKPLTRYMDYRSYLADWIADRKDSGMPGSNRWFAQKMHINSASWLTDVLRGRKGLSKATANRLSVVLKHPPAESRYFETLVAYNQAKTLAERNAYYEELLAVRKIKDPKVVSPDQYEYYAAWYHSAVRSLIGMFPFSGDFERLAKMVSPQISPRQARHSVELLERLGIVRRDSDGVYRLDSNAVTTGQYEKSLAISNFQQETMRLALEALDRYPRSLRDISTLTVGVSAKSVEEIRRLAAEFRRRVTELANSDEEADRVYQVNIQAFPLSSTGGARKARA